MSHANNIGLSPMLILLLLSVMPTTLMANICADADSALALHSEQSSPVSAAASDKTDFSYQFDSGAQWDFCWYIDKHTGLSLTNIHYRPPGETAAKLMQSASLAQILIKYDEDTHANHILSSHGLGGTNHIAPDRNNCPAGESRLNTDGTGICTRLRDLNTLTTVRRSRTLRRHELSLHAYSTVGAQTYEQVWRLSEDGQITPSVRISGVLDRFTRKQEYGTVMRENAPLAANATLLFTWRLDFNIGNTPNNDIVEQIEFVPRVDNGVKRAMTKQLINVESSHNVQRNRFRGWLIRDAELSAGPGRTTRMGYYLDPQSSGFAYVNRLNNWATFDLSITRNRPCEQLASKNNAVHPNCGNSLDQFVNDEPLSNQNPVLWFSLARQLLPKAEDFPAITTREASFKLIPFDWSASTPFTPLTE